MKIDKQSWRFGELSRASTPSLCKNPKVTAFLDKVVTIINVTSIAIGFLGVIAIFGIALLMGSEVVVRLLGHSLVFSWEYSSYLMAASFFLTAGFTLLSGGHVRVVLFSSHEDSKIDYAIEIIATVIAICVFSVLAYSLVEATNQYLVRGTKSYTPASTPMAIPMGVTAVGACALWLQGIARLLGLLIGRRDTFVFHDASPTEG